MSVEQENFTHRKPELATRAEISGREEFYGLSAEGDRGKYQDRIKIEEWDDDFFTAAVFDGHDVSEAVNEVQAKLLPLIRDNIKAGKERVQAIREAFFTVNEDLKAEGINGGTTASVVLCDRKNKKFDFAWLGDSPIYLIKKDGDVKELIEPHTVDNQKEVQRVGEQGIQIRNRYFQGQDAIQLSRALGDFQISFLSAEPEIREHKIEDDDCYAMLATDGIVLDAEEIAATFLKNKDLGLKELVRKIFNESKKKDTNESFGFDDASAILIDLKKVFRI